MTQEKLAIIIVGYKSKKLLASCLESLFRSSDQSFIVFYIDNSNDGSREWVEQHYPQVKTFPNAKNLGFAGGNNYLLRRALKQNYEHFLLLNPDTFVDPTAVKLLRANRNAAPIIQPLLLIARDGQKTNRVNSGGNVVHYLGFSYCGGYNLPVETFGTQLTAITVASGAAVMINRQVLETVGFLDETFFLYHEDTDFCWRARIAGFDSMLLPTAHVWHEYNFNRNTNKFFYSERNRLIFLYKNFQWQTLVLTAPMFWFNELLMNAYAIKAGWFGAKIRSYGAAIKMLKTAKKDRQHIQQFRRQPDRALKKLLSSTLEFEELNIPLINLYNQCLAFYWRIIYKLV